MTTATDEIRIVDNEERHRYEAWSGEDLAAFATYRRLPGRIVFLHTETAPAFTGRGIGTSLAAAALDAARGDGRRVTPICPFIAAFIKRHPAYADLVDPGEDP